MDRDAIARAIRDGYEWPTWLGPNAYLAAADALGPLFDEARAEGFKDGWQTRDAEQPLVEKEAEARGVRRGLATATATITAEVAALSAVGDAQRIMKAAVLLTIAAVRGDDQPQETL